jgi:hypothetical protein
MKLAFETRRSAYGHHDIPEEAFDSKQFVT